MASHEPSSATDGVLRMFQFLLQSEEMRSRPVRTLDGAPHTLWLGDLPRDAPSVTCGLFDTDAAQTWLRVDRLHHTEPPALPGLLRPWVDPEEIRDFRREGAPGLRREALVAVPDDAREDSGATGVTGVTDEGEEDPPDTEPERHAERSTDPGAAPEARTAVPDARTTVPDARTAEQDARTTVPDARTGEPPSTRVLELTAHPRHDDVVAAHRDWAEDWETWSERERRVAPLVRLYEEVFRIHQEAVDLGEAYELVLGVGHLAWRAEDQPIRRHLVTRRAVLTMDDQGRIELAPDPDSPGFVLEEDMLEAAQRLREEPRERVGAALAEASGHDGPDGAEHLHTALTEWALAVSAGARYQRRADRPIVDRPRAHTPGDAALVTFAPAVILRERPKRGQVNALREISEEVSRHGVLTDLLRHIVGADGTEARDPDHVDDEAWADAPAQGASPRTSSAPDELFFSLPSNTEQRRVADRLRRSDLVVVQGPPGTGKTHSIANLVTDLLARGQRILITSQTPRALKVLKDKLPASIRPLAVSRTGDGLDAQRELENSVQAILGRQAEHDPASADAEIDALQARLDRARTERDRALKDLRAIREQETYEHPHGVGDYAGTLTAIAERLAREETLHSWIGEVGTDRPPFDPARVLALLHAARAFTPELRAITAQVPEAARIPLPSQYADALAAIARAEEAAGHAADSWGGDLDALLSGLPRERCARLRARVEEFTAARDMAARLDPRWDTQRRGTLEGRDREVRAQAEAVRAALESADRELGQVGPALIDGLDRFGLAEALGYATRLHEGMSAGGRLHGFLGLRSRLAKDTAPFLEAVTVDGRVPDTERAASALLHRVAAERALFEAEHALATEGEAANWSDPRTRAARLHDAVDDLDRLLALASARTALTDAVAGLPRLTSLDWSDEAEVDGVAVLLAAVDAEQDAAPARDLVEALRGELRAWSDRSYPEPEALRRARAAVDGADPDGYAAACADLERVREAVRREQDFESARAEVRAGHPVLAESIAAEPDDPAWDGRLAGLEQAWAWSAWNRRLAELTDPSAEDRCRARLREADGDARLTMAALAAAMAWRACLRRLTRDQEVALRSYQQSVRQIGKGTGKYAHRHRHHAREALRECQPAVPAWIMPLYQVVSTIPMDTPGVFDVVIIDEASQSGPEALLLAWLGKRLVVVGDDKQVSPANVGVDQEQVFTLQARHLGAFPASRRSLFSPNRSLFDIASGLAGSRGQLMLKEHFRCMPEIIGFSNEHFYDGGLQPLRQYGADRLPPLRTVHVADGVLEGRDQRQVNRAEATRLVEQLVECCADPAYGGLTMGVVTLQSGGQQALIEDLISLLLPLEERIERRVRVGNAAAFQGDERDVMFISAVYAPFDIDGEPRRAAPYSSVNSQQAINVAASRARDQVWFFHSFALSDLGPTDLRRAYLDYLRRPAQEQGGTGIGEVPADERVAPFDSLFEQRVYRALHARGYRVLPQYPAGHYRIDLVVEGGARRLAVECDGDAFHNEANADADAARQRELERVGWTFVRIRGSRFFRDQASALQPVWKQLAEMGIEPAGAGPA